MSSTEDNEKVRELAYHLWDQAGRPADREDEFWHQAKSQIETPPEAPKPSPEQAEPGGMIGR